MSQDYSNNQGSNFYSADPRAGASLQQMAPGNTGGDGALDQNGAQPTTTKKTTTTEQALDMKYGAYSTSMGDDGGVQTYGAGRDQSPTNAAKPGSLAEMRAQMMKNGAGADQMQLQQYNKGKQPPAQPCGVSTCGRSALEDWQGASRSQFLRNNLRLL